MVQMKVSHDRIQFNEPLLQLIPLFDSWKSFTMEHTMIMTTRALMKHDAMTSLCWPTYGISRKVLRPKAYVCTQTMAGSTFQWAQILRSKGHLLGFKSTSCPIPVGSGLAANTFFLAVQTGWQCKMFVAHGGNLSFNTPHL